MLIARRTGVAVVVVEHLGAFVDDTVAPRQRLLAKMVYEAADLVCPVSVAVGQGVEHLLHALAIVGARGPVALDVAGDGPSRPELEALARRLGLEDAVRFLGRQSAPRIAELMRGADLLVVPSLSENLPVVILEAQATGLPVVASDVGGVRGVRELVKRAERAACARSCARSPARHSRRAV